MPTNLQDFTTIVRDVTESAPAAIEQQITEEVVEAGITAAIRLSPKLTGLLRGNYRIGVGAAAAGGAGGGRGGVIQRYSDGEKGVLGPGDIAQIEEELAKLKNRAPFSDTVISNGAPYLDFVNSGTATQEAQAFVEAAQLEMLAAAEAIVAELSVADLDALSRRRVGQ